MRRKFSIDEDIWFTADTHFGHPGIINHCAARAEFKTEPLYAVTAMNERMIENWNSVVKPDSHIFHLGDFSFKKPAETVEILKRLNGYKYFIRGNHDRNNVNDEVLSYFEGGVEHYHEITWGQQLICLCHFPFKSWNGMHHNSWNLHGHSHGNLPISGKQLDVGVDVHNLTPINIHMVKEIMDCREFKAIDHHTDRGTN